MQQRLKIFSQKNRLPCKNRRKAEKGKTTTRMLRGQRNDMRLIPPKAVISRASGALSKTTTRLSGEQPDDRRKLQQTQLRHNIAQPDGFCKREATGAYLRT